VWGQPLYSLICSPDSWLEASIKLEGPATGHFDQGFFSIFLLVWLYGTLHAYHAALLTSTSEFRPKRNIPNVIKA
jgi:hypothetical protein